MTARRERLTLGWWIHALAGLAVTIAVVLLLASVWAGNSALTLDAAAMFAWAFPAYLVVVAVQAAGRALRRRVVRR